jgi:ergothioneine biosynthesis protein EgtB
MQPTQTVTEVPHNLLRRLADARSETDKLLQLVRPEALYQRPIPERHRIVFYIGHLEAFDWNLLRVGISGVRSSNAQFDRLFAFGIDPVDGNRPSDQPGDWPCLEEVHRYTAGLRDRLDEALVAPGLKNSAHAGEGQFSVTTLLNVAIEHRLMHAETLAYMLHQLPLEDKVRQEFSPAPGAAPVKFRMVEIPAGLATLGAVRNGTDAFGWDNEFNAHSVYVSQFEIDEFKVTNGQYLRFMEAGGYEDRSLWPAEDWAWKAEQNISAPVFWTRRDGGWQYRAMFQEFPLPLEWPVYVSHAEANAYARWAGKRLPTEAQWHRAAYGSPDGTERPYPWGPESPRRRHGYFDFLRWDPVPVNAFPQARGAFGIADLLSNGWEWTSSVFEPFSGFEPFPFYPGYSANFFDGKHYVIKGGSVRTEAGLLRRSFRNWFQPRYQYVYAGFRCVK